MRISYSSFSTYNRCPLQYKFSYVDRIKVPEKPEFFFGGLIHEIVQYALKKDPILPPLEELLEKLKVNWRPDIFPTEADSKKYFEFGIEMIKKFYAGFKPGLRNIVATEKRFQIPLNDEHVLSGIIDRVDKLPYGAFEIIDYKTSKSLPTQSEVDTDKQLATYNLAAQILWPEAKDVKLTLYFLKFDSQITTKRREDEVLKIKEEIIQTAEAIGKETKYEPKLNNLCDWCDFQHLCPLKQKDKSKDEIKINTIMREYILAQKKIKDLEPEINDYFDSENIDNFTHKEGTICRSKDKKLNIDSK